MSERRPDPRVDPLSIPPEKRVREEVDPTSDERSDPMSNPPLRALVEPIIVEKVAISTIIAEKSRTEPPPEDKAGRVVVTDPRLESLERKLAANDWNAIKAELGSLEEVGHLPPNLGLGVALAHHELAPEGSQEAIAVGVRCMGALLGVGESSPMAGLIGRRTFRKNFVRGTEKTPPPPARISVPWIVLALVVGAAVGWLAGGGLAMVRGMAGHA
jgi:hypothetical protein